MEGFSSRNRKMQTPIKQLGLVKARKLAREIQKAQQAHTEWRIGQAVFNVLDIQHKRLAEEVRYTKGDAFYVDANLTNCYQIILTPVAFRNLAKTKLPLTKE